MRPSQARAREHLAQLEPAVRAARVGREGARLLPQTVVWPAGLDRSLLPQMHLTVRVWNCLNQAKLTNGDSALVAETLWRLPNFGRRSLVDLVLAVEKFLLGCTNIHDVPNAQTGAVHQGDNGNRRVPGLGGQPNTSGGMGAMSADRWERATTSLRSLLATSADILGTPTLADALRPDVLRLANRMGVDAPLRSVPLHEAMLGTPGLPAIVARRLNDTLRDLTDGQRTIVQARLAEQRPATLEEVGRRLGVTRERVRQIQTKLAVKIRRALGPEIGVIATTLQEHLDPLVPSQELEQRIDGIIPEASATVTSLCRHALIQAMGLTLDGDFYVDEKAVEVIQDVKSRARELADDAGLIQERALIESLPDERWRRFWPWIRRLCALHRLHGALALRDSAQARTKAALLAIGRPATKEEIGALCGYEAKQVGSYLANIPSVVRADTERLGIRDWIDDEYDGIVGEIIQRIEEDGGVTTTERLLREIPSKFKVSPTSVQLYMRTARFEIRNGSISLASPTSVRLRHLDDVVHGHDDGGAPFWTFLVEDRYFQGYSVVGVPPEFAKALGCEPDSGVEVRLDNLPDCRALSLNWRLSSLTGASLGRVAEPLRRLGLQTGDRARVTIVADRSLRLGPDEDHKQRDSRQAEAALARILGRRRAI